MRAVGLMEIIAAVVGGVLCLLMTAGAIALIVWLIARSKNDEERPDC